MLEDAGTWELVDLPAGANLVGSKWVFWVKKDAAGQVVHFKAHLVAQGFSQVPGVDYFNTFMPVAKLASIQTVLAMAAKLDFKLHQIDIKSAYLNGELTENENIFMKQPPSYPAPNSSGKVCQNTVWLEAVRSSLVSEACGDPCEVFGVCEKQRGPGCVLSSWWSQWSRYHNHCCSCRRLHHRRVHTCTHHCLQASNLQTCGDH